jgi:hypothetical protein
MTKGKSKKIAFSSVMDQYDYGSHLNPLLPCSTKVAKQDILNLMLKKKVNQVFVKKIKSNPETNLYFLILKHLHYSRVNEWGILYFLYQTSNEEA